MIRHVATGHHRPTFLLDSSSKRTCPDSDLGPSTSKVRDQVLHRGHVPCSRLLRLPHLESPPGPGPARCRPDFIPPRSHVTLTHDSLAATHVTALSHRPCISAPLLSLLLSVTPINLAARAPAGACSVAGWRLRLPTHTGSPGRCGTD
jgi:hypothetical protein